MPADSSPDHNGAASKGDHLLNCIGSKPLSCTPPDAGSAITGIQTEPRFICKQNLCPLGTCPPLMHSAPCMTVGSLVLCQHGFSDWTTGTKVAIMEAITCCLYTDCSVGSSSQMSPDVVGRACPLLCGLAADVVVLSCCRFLGTTRATLFLDCSCCLEPMPQPNNDGVGYQKSA